MSERPLILVTNDDGVGAPGIRAVAEALRDVGDVMIAAPDRERSAASHSISLDRPLRVDEIEPGVFSIDGTPVDCVYLALLHLVPRKPALCVSGINNGYNLGSDVFYSGTVAGAVEGALRGVPSIAVSLQRQKPQDFSHAAAFLKALAAEAVARGPGAIPDASLLSVNVPPGPLRGYQVTFLGRRVYRDQVEVRQDLRGRSYYWIGGPEENATDLPGSDCSAVRAGLASVTPLALDLTHTKLLGELVGWRVGNFVHDAAQRAKI
ncbi:MAG TPA: 5'/3'-nucleotidase SurE [Polyangia bacterium]|jgi:5'-nucleotidase|nr:5'/3'-nucleotidase SurE [Polyangia bacterium]